jgi:hypothetical protein
LLTGDKAIDSKRQTLNGMDIEHCGAKPPSSRGGKTGTGLKAPAFT